ncbi:hypothetical protein BTVI_152769 [Pitangus sulphuratus]|nr:hypothetical protein BTVI_152769 [Pitangus sulphuratus]
MAQLGYQKYHYQHLIPRSLFEINAKKDLGVLVDEKLSMSQQHVLAAQKGNCVLGYSKSSVASRSREGILYSALVRPHLESCAQLRGPQHRRDMNLFYGLSPEEATKMVRGMEERVRELVLFSLEKRRLWDNLIVTYQYLKGAYKNN